jgi:hypothetical protein
MWVERLAEWMASDWQSLNPPGPFRLKAVTSAAASATNKNGTKNGTMEARADPSQVFLRKRDGLFKERPATYILILLVACVASFLYQLRVDNIFACSANGYTSDRYLSSCETNYGDYEHGAFWFDLEPAAEMSAANADVLFLGDSRMLRAFSTAATAKWSSSASASFYLLGFYAFENSIFERALLHKLKPRAEVYVIPVGDFFEPFEAPVAKNIMHDSAARNLYDAKRYLQFVHKSICMKLPQICGNNFAVFRSRQTGMWYMQTSRFKGREHQVSYDQRVYEREIEDAIPIGRVFLSELPVKTECVIFTLVPTVGAKLSVANAIAGGLGKVLMDPGHLDDLQTFDGTHLDQESAERWSEAFFKAAGPQIQKCLRANHGGNVAESPS